MMAGKQSKNKHWQEWMAMNILIHMFKNRFQGCKQFVARAQLG